MTLIFQAGDHLVHLALAKGLQLGGGELQHRLPQPQPASNRQGVAAARDTPLQPVSGREGVHIEGHRGVLEARIVVFEGLELAEVGGSDREPGPIGQVLEQGRGQGRTLKGIGASPHLIEQHQRGAASRARPGKSFEDAGDAADVAAEGGEVLLQRLLIADVGQHLAAPGQPRSAAAGQEQARPSHKSRQADAFEGHGFAAGVGARDRHHPQLRCHQQAHGHHRMAALTPLLPKQQGVAQLTQFEGRAGVVCQLRAYRPQPLAVARPSHPRIQAHQHLLECGQSFSLLAHLGAQGSQHGPLQFPLAPLQVAYAIAQGNHRLGFDEHRLSRSRAVVHQPWQLSGSASLHSQHGTAVALRDHRVLEHGAAAAHQLLQSITPI